MTSHPPAPEVLRQLQKAQAELAQRQFAAAAATLEMVLAEAPDLAPALGLAAMAAQMQGQHERAADFFGRALARQPDNAGLQAGLGISLFEAGDPDGAVAALRRACDLAPNVAAGWYNLGKALKLAVHTDEAIASLQRCLQLDAAHVPARLTLADAHASIGEVERAAAELRHVLATHPKQAHAWFALANLKVVPLTATDAGALRAHFADSAAAPEDRVLFGFALARALEDQDDVRGSFEVLQMANRLQRRRVRWSAAEHGLRVRAVQRAFSAAPPPAPSASPPGGGVILIASMPRSGSSLVEQILASHPLVEGANEIGDLQTVIDEESRRCGRPFPDWVADAGSADWSRLGADYLARTERWHRRKARFTDKSLANWMHVGAALSMLPAARVVVVRRDPLETCLACYRQWFAADTAFAYDFDELADYCADFTQLTRFWLQRHPRQVLDVQYEALVADPDAVIRGLLDFCGLPFDPACLDFHRTRRTVASAASAGQVRQPLQRNTARAERYGDILDGLRASLHKRGQATVFHEGCEK